MNSNQFLVIIGCILCLALGLIALSQATEDPETAASVHVMEFDSIVGDAATPVRL
jgi:hypothetical protein